MTKKKTPNIERKTVQQAWITKAFQKTITIWNGDKIIMRFVPIPVANDLTAGERERMV